MLGQQDWGFFAMNAKFNTKLYSVISFRWDGDGIVIADATDAAAAVAAAGYADKLASCS